MSVAPAHNPIGRKLVTNYHLTASQQTVRIRQNSAVVYLIKNVACAS
jgi:hypothetical protein